MAYTYTTLKTAIQDYTQNTETTFTNQLSRFIINSEERILKECQLSVFRKNVSGSLSSSNKFLTKPTDFLAPFSLSVVVSSETNFNYINQRWNQLAWDKCRASPSVWCLGGSLYFYEGGD